MRGQSRGKRSADDGDVELDIVIESPDWSALPGVEDLVQRAAAAALAAAGISEYRHITVLLTGDERLAELNGIWRGKRQPTNVLSFPAALLPGSPEAARRMGDIALAWGVVDQEARRQGKTLENHASHLIVHGVLHLAGLDHETDDAAAAMRALETRALSGLGIADPY